MTSSRIRTFAFLGLGLLLSLDLAFFLVDLSPSGVKVSTPVSRHTYPQILTVEGSAWMDGVDSAHTVKVTAEGASGDLIEATAPRDAVTYQGKTAFLLNSFKAVLEFPVDGYWRIRAVMYDDDGEPVDEAVRIVKIQEGAVSGNFSGFTIGHLLPSLVIVFLCLGVGLFFSKSQTETVKKRFESFIAVTLCVNETAYHLYWYLTGGWIPASSLLVQMCGLSILMLIVVFAVEKESVRAWMFELIFFWGLGGALQAIITPDIGARGFPDYKYFSFFLSHGMIMVGAVYIVAARGYRPTIRSIIRVVIITNVLVVLSYGFNILLEKVPPFQRGNYFVTGYPPPTNSVVDLFAKIFGPSPMYMIGLEVMGIFVFLLLWFPFALTSRLKNSPRKSQDDAASQSPVPMDFNRTDPEQQ